MAPQELEILCSEQLAVPNEDLALSEAEFFEKNTFIDFPVPPMARPSTPSASAPAGFLQRFLLPPKQSMTAVLPLGASCSTECSESDTMEILATLEELPEKNTFIDFPPPPMARPSTPTASAPAFLHRLQHLMTPEQGKPVVEASKELQCEDSKELVEEALGLPSMGSADHHAGKCSPCAWYWKSGGCRNGATCIYCHLCPEGTRKAMKKAKVAMFRQQELEPVYVPMSPVPSEAASPASVESLEVLQKPSVHFAENYLDEDDGRAPVKVSIKNTFIQFEVPSSPKNTSSPPLRSAPGDFFRRFFRTVEPESLDSSLPPATPTTPTSPHAFATRPEPSSNGPQAHSLGECTPCAYFWYKKDGCRKGEECEMCHLCPKGEIKRRKKARVQNLKAAGAYMPGFSKIKMSLDC